jgi:hypothetical protein
MCELKENTKINLFCLDTVSIFDRVLMCEEISCHEGKHRAKILSGDKHVTVEWYTKKEWRCLFCGSILDSPVCDKCSPPTNFLSGKGMSDEERKEIKKNNRTNTPLRWRQNR